MVIANILWFKDVVKKGVLRNSVVWNWLKVIFYHLNSADDMRGKV